MPFIPKFITYLFICFITYVGTRFIYLTLSNYITALRKLSKSSILISAAISLKLFIIFTKTAIPYVSDISDALIFFTYVFLFIQIIDLLVTDLLSAKYRAITIPPLLHSIILWIIYVIVVLFILRTYLNLNITPLLATSAVFSMVIGLALQDLLVNLFSGIVLSLEKPFDIHDWVSINNNIGKVFAITWRTTKIRLRSNDLVIIPNAIVTKQEIINFSVPTKAHERKIDIGLSYSTPPNEAKQIIFKAIKETNGILENPAARVTISGYKDFFLNYTIRFWINDYDDLVRIEDDLHTHIWYLLKRNNIEIPFPTRTSYIHSMTDELIKEKNNQNEILSWLRQVGILKPLSESELTELSKGLNFQKFGTGEIIFHENEQGDSFYIIKSGLVEVSKQVKFGKSSVISTLGPGNYFGEMSLLTGEKRNATIKALEDTELIAITHGPFKKILVNNPDIVESLSRILEERQSGILKELANSQTGNEVPAVSGYDKFIKKIKVFFGI
ncbi:MAG: mechanosensitive ion channel family protein [bacterium]|nr:mechanosensitive ion channel family protein [bacterium]